MLKENIIIKRLEANLIKDRTKLVFLKKLAMGDLVKDIQSKVTTTEI